MKKLDGTPTKNPRDYDFIRLTILENRADGTKNKQPDVVDGYGRSWDQSVEIGNGSIADILVRYVDYGTTQGLYFKKMRVLKLEEFTGGGADFEPLSEDDEFFARLPDGMEPQNNFEQELDDDVPY